MPQVLPPANGKKLWRVKRSVSTGNIDSDSPSLSSLECLNNSLKISAAAAKFSIRRPPLKRPKNRPGKPKDFVFVDLSPVKNEDCEVFSAPNSAHPSPHTPVTPPQPTQTYHESKNTQNMFELPQLNESYSSLSDSDSIFSGFDRDSSFTAYMQEQPFHQDQHPTEHHHSHTTSPQQDDCMGLGIMNLGVQSWEQNPSFHERAPAQNPAVDAQMLNQQLYGYQAAMMEQYKQIQYLKQQLQQQQTHTQPQPIAEVEPPVIHVAKRSKSTSDVNTKKRPSGQFQFKSYTGPNKKFKHMKHRRCVSEQTPKKSFGAAPASPTTPEVQSKPLGLEDFMMLNEQFPSYMNPVAAGPQITEGYQTYTPVSEYSDEDEFYLPKSFENAPVAGCGIDQFLLSKQEDLFTGFVPI